VSATGKFYDGTEGILFGDLSGLPKPSEVAQPPYQGRFGMCEMETAAAVIMKRCLTNDSWYHQFGLDDFTVPPYTCCRQLGWHEHGFGHAVANPAYRGDRADTLASDGFLQFLARGWMLSSYPNSVFRLHPDFVKRLGEERTKRAPKP
jgi:hypothetical protein